MNTLTEQETFSNYDYLVIKDDIMGTKSFKKVAEMNTI